MSVSVVRQKDISNRVSILKRRTIKLDYKENINKQDHNIFNLNQTVTYKAVDKDQVEKMVEDKIRSTSPYFFGQRNKNFVPIQTKTTFNLGSEKCVSRNHSSSVGFERNMDKPQNIRLNVIKKDESKRDVDQNIVSNNENKSEINKSMSIIENDSDRPLSIYIKYNKHLSEKIKAREHNTKLVSKSFVDIRENVKEMLRNSMEKENCFYNKERKDPVYEKAKNRFNQTEKIQQKMKMYITKPKVKVDEYYQKFVDNYKEKNGEDTWNSMDVKKGKMRYYKEELNNQINLKKKLKEQEMKLENLISAEHINNKLKEQEKKDINRVAKIKAYKDEFINQNEAIINHKNQKKEVERMEKIEDGLRIKKDNDAILKEELDNHLKKNKYQKYILDSLNKQIEYNKQNKLGKGANTNININNFKDSN